MATKVASSQAGRAAAEFIPSSASYAQVVLNAGQKESMQSGKEEVPATVEENEVAVNGEAEATASGNDSGENDSSTTPKVEKVEFVEAPPPKVNPWMVNKNAASVIVGKKEPTPVVHKERRSPQKVRPVPVVPNNEGQSEYLFSVSRPACLFCTYWIYSFR